MASIASIRFARHALDNLQSVIRFADTKAGALTALIFLIGGIGYNLFDNGLDKLSLLPLSWKQWPDYLFFAAWTVFWISAAATVLRVLFLVVLPRTASHYRNPTETHDLLYWEHILLHQTNMSYFNAIDNMEEAVELRNLTDQVYELAHITQAKMKALQEMRQYLVAVIASWLVGIAAATLLNLRG